MKEFSLSVLLTFLFLYGFTQTTRYVMEGGTNAKTGTSWANASDDIQAMINASSSGDRIFVAVGIYKPNRRADALNVITVGDRVNAFVMKNGVALYGGFDPTNGIDDLSDVRIIPSKNGSDERGKSILSGDFNNDDIITGSGGASLSITGNSENAHHVIIAVNASVSVNLDGFTITGGNSNNSNENISVNGHSFWGGSGGAIYSWASTTSSTVTLTSCEVTGNSAVSGGGVFCWASYYPNTATVSTNNSSFTLNFSTSGGSIYISSAYAVANVLNSSISGSLATHGGGMYIGSILSSNISITNSVIKRNSASSGGGINSYVSGSTSTALSNFVAVTGSDITENSANNGGGIYIYCYNYSISSSNVTIENSNIKGNLASFSGGGIYSYASSSTVNSSSSKVSIVRSSIVGNQSALFGGGVFSSSITSTPAAVTTTSFVSAINSNISGNSSNNGSGIFSSTTTSSSEVSLINTTLAGNTGLNHIHFLNNGTKKLVSRNSIIFGNKTSTGTPSSIFSNNGSAINKDIRYSLVQGEIQGDNNLDGNSVNYTTSNLFSDAENGDYSLNSGSPVINTGNNNFYEEADGNSINNSFATDKDLAGNSRVYDYANGGIIDMGAYEYQVLATLPVELKNFTAFLENNKVRLEWNTLSETNNKEFIISSSIDKSSFKEISRVPAAMSTQIINNYVQYDKQPSKGNNYYRLAQVDNNGKIVVLGERIVKFSFDSDVVAAYPNPTKDEVKVGFYTGIYSVALLLDFSGKQIEKKIIDRKQKEILLNLSRYPRGIYFLKLIGNSSVSIKLIKD